MSRKIGDMKPCSHPIRGARLGAPLRPVDTSLPPPMPQGASPANNSTILTADRVAVGCPGQGALLVTSEAGGVVHPCLPTVVNPGQGARLMG